MQTESGSNAVTVYFENGEQVYPCRCGEVHRGPYAIYDYGHHTCTHDHDLVPAHEGVMCIGCGKEMFLAPGYYVAKEPDANL